MKKKFLSIMTVMVLVCSVCMTALAEEEISRLPVQKYGGTAAELKSHGRIVYQESGDTITVDSGDLYMLAEQIDQVKLHVSKQLETMHTYFSTGEGIALSTSEDVTLVHAKPREEDSVDPLDVNFDTLLQGIALSQSVSQDVTAYGYPAGVNLYRNAKGHLTADGSEAGVKPINDLKAATADDLSAGTVAWVDGKPLLGTGGSNQSYYDAAYKAAMGSGYFNKTYFVSSYTVPFDMKDVFVLTGYKNDVIPPVYSPAPAAAPQVFYENTHTGGSDNHNQHLYMQFIPELKAGTRITVNTYPDYDPCYLWYRK